MIVTDPEGASCTENVLIEIEEEASPPAQILDATLTPQQIYNDSIVLCSPSVSASGPYGESYFWSNSSGTAISETTQILTLDPSLAMPNDILTCNISVTDASGTSTLSVSETVLNRTPTLSVSVSPTTATEIDTLTCSATALDPDGETPGLTYSWNVVDSNGAIVSPSLSTDPSFVLTQLQYLQNALRCRHRNRWIWSGYRLRRFADLKCPSSSQYQSSTAFTMILLLCSTVVQDPDGAGINLQLEYNGTHTLEPLETTLP